MLGLEVRAVIRSDLKYDLLMKMSFRRFLNQRYVLPTVALLLVIFARLIVASFEFGNMKGFVISMIHALVVAVGTLWCLHDHPDTITRG